MPEAEPLSPKIKALFSPPVNVVPSGHWEFAPVKPNHPAACPPSCKNLIEGLCDSVSLLMSASKVKVTSAESDAKCNFDVGALVPIPTLPLLFITALVAPPV